MTDTNFPSLTIGDPAGSAGLPAPAPLQVGCDLAHQGAVATFSFTSGPNAGGFAIGSATGPGTVELLQLMFDDGRVRAVDQTGATFSVSDA